MGKRLHRLRHRCSSLEVSEPRPALNLLKLLCLLRELAKICCKRRRVRCRRLHATTADPKRTPGDLRAANRQDSIGAAVMAGPSISRIKKIIFFRPPVSAPLISLDANVHIVLQKQLGSGERRADVRVDAPQQVFALGRVLVGPEMPDAVRGPRVDD